MTSFTRRAYMDFVAAFTRRYGPHGAFWAGKSYGASALRARYLQIWNEPNLKNYWNDNPQPSQYASFLYAASNSAIAADADVRIVSAGLPWGKGIPPEDFLRGMNVWGSGQVFRKISAVGVHVYKSYPHQIPPALRSIRATLRSLSTTAGARPVWITEMGWATGPFDGRYQVSEARQAANLKEIYNTLVSLKDSGSYNIDRAYWYNLVDVEPGDRWWRNTGLFRRSGTPKPAWRELKRVTGAV